jgi:hypothetical protein
MNARIAVLSTAVTTAVTAALLAACGSKPASTEVKPATLAATETTDAGGRNMSPPSTENPQTRIEMRKVLLGDDVEGTLRIQWLNGQVYPTKLGSAISLDDKNSFLVQIQNGVMSTSLSDMTRLMNNRIFSYPGSPLSHLVLSAKGTQLKLNASLKKDLDLPVEIIADVGTTPKGDMKLHVASLKTLKLSLKGMLGMFGLKVGDLVDAKGAKGVTVDGNDLILDIERLLPPPRKRGRITKVEVSGNDLIETFGTQAFQPSSDHRSYLKFQGGAIEFGKLRMSDCDLTLSDPDKPEWFDFNLDHYQRQLVAGINKITPANGLESFVPGYARVAKSAAATKREP